MTAPSRRQTYGSAFYEKIRKGSQDSAAVIVPMILDVLPEQARFGQRRSVLDVGAGEAWFAAEFEKYGCMVHAIDAGQVKESAVEVLYWDLMQSFGNLYSQVDLVVCLEVAEHLPESRAASFIADLCEAGRAVLFSAAIPGQGGDGHINMQWPRYWQRLFYDAGYLYSMGPRWQIWDDQRVKPWYRNNLGLAIPKEELGSFKYPEWFTDSGYDCHAVIHPDMWIDWKSAYTGPR
jgi:hypothetical protein